MVKEFIYPILIVTLLGIGSILVIDTNHKIISSPRDSILKIDYADNFSRSIEINIPSRKLFLVEGNLIVKEYEIGVGKSENFMTPLGLYKISKMEVEPSISDSEFIEDVNSTNGRLISFLENENRIEYSIQETSEAKQVGMFSSLGNIQMLKEDLAELYSLVEIGTTVKIKYERIELSENKDDLSITIFPDPYNIAELNYRQIEDQIFRNYPSVILDDEKLQKLLTQPVQQDLVASIGKLTKNQLT